MLAPNKTTKIGVSEFKTPANPLGTTVSATANKKAGIAFPKIPTAVIAFTCLFLSVFKCLIENGRRTSPANTILKEPSAKGE